MTSSEANDLNTRFNRPKLPGTGFAEMGIATEGMDSKVTWMYCGFVMAVSQYKFMDTSVNLHPLRDGLTPIKARVAKIKDELKDNPIGLGDALVNFESTPRSLSFVHYQRLDLLRRAGYFTLEEFDAVVRDLNEALTYAKDLYREGAKLNPTWAEYVDSRYEYEDRRQRETIPVWREAIVNKQAPGSK